MQYQAQYQSFNTLLTQYLKLSEAYTVKGQVQAVSKELTLMAKQSHFLEVALRTMLAEPRDRNRLVFVSSLIKDKFKFDFEMVQREKLLNYYHKICEIGFTLGCKIYPLYTNLSLALAYIYIHISARSEEQLQAFLKPFTPSEPKHYEYFNYYFKVLECLAVEVDNSRLVIDEEYREIAKGKLLAQQYAILLRLNEITAAAWEVATIDNQNILQCFIEWVTVSYNPQVLNSLPDHYAMNRLFQYVTDQRSTSETADCIKRLILHLKNPTEVPIFYDYLGKKVVELLAMVDYMIEQAQLGEAEDYLRLIVEFCRKSIPTFVGNFDERVCGFLRTMAKHTQEEIIQVYDSLLEFWEEFIAEATVQKAQRALPPQLGALVQQVHQSVCEKCHYSLKVILELDTRNQSQLFEVNHSADDIRTRRDRTTDLFQKMAAFFGKNEYVKLVFGKMQGVSQKADQFLWPYLEVYLFSLIEAMKKIQRLTPEVSQIVSIYIELSSKPNFSAPIILRKTFLSVFKSLMTIQEKDISFVKLLFNLTSTSFDNELLMSHAERTFAKGCQCNHQIMKSTTEDMMALVQQYPHREYIIRGVIQLICRYEDATVKYLPSILTYIFTKMQQAANDRYLTKELMYSLTAIIKILLQVTPDNPTYSTILAEFTRHAFPFILETVKNPRHLESDEDPEVQRMIKLLKIIMRYLKFNFTEFISPLYTAVLEAFPRYPICSYAYLLQIAITVFYQKQEYAQYFKGVFVRFCEITFQHMNQISKMEKYSYLLDDFIGISKRFFVYNAGIVLNSGQLPNLINLCTSAFIGSDTPRIARAAYTFFETIFMVYWRQELVDDYNTEMTGQKQKFSRKSEDELLYFQLRALLVDKLEHILGKILEHLSTVPSESTREQILFVLLAEIKAFPQQNMVIWPKILGQLPADILVANEKARFKANLELMLSQDVAQMREAAGFLKRYVYLMNKRMINANNRKLRA